MALRIEGYVIVSADGMLADAQNVMPEALKFEGDQSFFTAALDRADLIVHGRNSFEDQPNSPRRKRIVLTRSVAAIAPDPANPKATLWNPAGASFEDACDAQACASGTAAIIGGPGVFEMFMDRYDTFWLSQAPKVRLPGGEPCFPVCPRVRRRTFWPHGLKAGEARISTPPRSQRHAMAAWRLEQNRENYPMQSSMRRTRSFLRTGIHRASGAGQASFETLSPLNVPVGRFDRARPAPVAGDDEQRADQRQVLQRIDQRLGLSGAGLFQKSWK